MNNLKILIVEGNIRQDSEFFIKAAGASAADNLKNLILKLEPSTNTEIINPGHEDETKKALENMSKYNGIVFTGGAMRLNDMTDVIKKHINFASNCFDHKNKAQHFADIQNKKLADIQNKKLVESQPLLPQRK